jgi:hypothetical protein
MNTIEYEDSFVDKKNSLFASFRLVADGLFSVLKDISLQTFFALLFSVFFLFVSKSSSADEYSDTGDLREDWVAYYVGSNPHALISADLNQPELDAFDVR